MYIPVSILRKSISGRHRPDVDLRRMLAGYVCNWMFLILTCIKVENKYTRPCLLK